MIWAFAAFTRPVSVGTPSILVGAALALLAVTGLLAQLSGPTGGLWLHRGGWLGWVVSGALRRPLGNVRALGLLTTLMAAAGLCTPQASSAGLPRALAARVAGLARLGRRRHPTPRAAVPSSPVAPPPPTPVVVERRPTPPAPAIALPPELAPAPS